MLKQLKLIYVCQIIISIIYFYSKTMAIEIEQLSSRLVEAEIRLKTEVARIKKKMQIQITELEMSLDVANKNNITLQMTIKKQSITLQVIYCSIHFEYGLWFSSSLISMYHFYFRNFKLIMKKCKGNSKLPWTNTAQLNVGPIHCKQS